MAKAFEICRGREMKNNPYEESYDDPVFAPIHPLARFGKNVKVGHYVVIEEDCEIGDGAFIGNFVVMRPKTKIGKNCRIGHGCIFEGRGIIGNNVTIMPHSQICIDAVVEDDVFIGPDYIGLNTKKIAHGRGKPVYSPPIIKRAARIGGGVIMMPGVVVGENALIAAGSVVTRDVPERKIVMGIPARIIGDVPKDELL
jgi:acetyltransferase-like isoleucine patch superfamily enzyme